MKTKILFIYSDQILVKDIPINYNYTLDKVIFYGAIFYIGNIALEQDYQVVLVINQVNLGTENFPRVFLYTLHEFLLKNLEDEGIYFSFVYIATFKETCNIGIRMLLSYFSKSHNYSQFFVLGNRIKLGGLLKEEVALHTSSKSKWKKIYNFFKFCFNECSYRRRSKETDIQIFIKINSEGISDIHTGFGFFNHILDQICIHANIDLGIKVNGDVYVDEHHSIEDTAIAIGIALSKSLKDKRGIARYGFLLPMDDVLVQVVIDLGGRSNLVWKTDFKREKIGNVPTEMFAHFFKSFTDVAYCNLHIQSEGNNEHHKIEAIFKAFACVLKIATSRNYKNDRLPSTKEIL